MDISESEQDRPSAVCKPLGSVGAAAEIRRTGITDAPLLDLEHLSRPRSPNRESDRLKFLEKTKESSKGDQAGVGDKLARLSEIDALGALQHATAVASLIQTCKTPFALSIHGEPGAGKTSFMQLVRELLDETRVAAVWFNAWQFSSFDCANHLPAFFIRHFRDAMNRGIKRGPVCQFQRGLKRAALFFRRLWRAIATLGAKPVEPSPEASRLAEIVGCSDPFTALGRAREDLHTLVQERLKLERSRCDGARSSILDRLRGPASGDASPGSGSDRDYRVVVFIDDLDRLGPAHAISFLEHVKRFMDLEGCCLIVAYDYGAIQRGPNVGGRDASGRSGRSLFDQIFQLSFNLHTESYDFQEYVKRMLLDVGFDEAAVAANVEAFRDMLIHSVGRNPRDAKRLVNKLVLMTDLLNQAPGPYDDWAAAPALHRQKIFFGMSCMESAFSQVYQWLLERLAGSPQGAAQLLGDQLTEEVGVRKLDDETGWFEGVADRDRMIGKLASFMDVFVRSLRSEDETELSNDAIWRLAEAARVMSPICRSDHGAALDHTLDNGIVRFCKQVKHELRTLARELFPSGGSKSALRKKGARAVWQFCRLDQAGWGVERGHYRLTFDSRRGGLLSIGLYWPQTYPAKAITERLYARGLLIESKYKFIEENSEPLRGIEYSYGQVQLSVTSDGKAAVNVSQAREVAEELCELIRAAHDIFDSLLYEAEEPIAGAAEDSTQIESEPSPPFSDLFVETNGVDVLIPTEATPPPQPSPEIAGEPSAADEERPWESSEAGPPPQDAAGPDPADTLLPESTVTSLPEPICMSVTEPTGATSPQPVDTRLPEPTSIEFPEPSDISFGDQVNAFCAKVVQRVESLCDNPQVQRSESATSRGEWLLYNVWYKPSGTKSAWSDGKLSYGLTFHSRNTHWIELGLFCDLAHLNGVGVSEELFQDLAKLSTLSDQGFHQGERCDGVQGILTQFGRRNLADEETVAVVAHHFRLLVEASSDLFDVQSPTDVFGISETPSASAITLEGVETQVIDQLQVGRASGPRLLKKPPTLSAEKARTQIIRKFLVDFRAGMSDEELMTKYKLSPTGFERLVKKLGDSGRLDET
jgi:hypothetical protein